MNIRDDITPKALKHSLENREYAIDWNSLKLFQYHDKNKPSALDGKSISGGLSVRIAIIDKPGKPTRPAAVFYKQKARNVKRIEEAYYLSDEEVLMFESRIQPKH
jgi:hypothetical protein